MRWDVVEIDCNGKHAELPERNATQKSDMEAGSPNCNSVEKTYACTVPRLGLDPGGNPLAIYNTVSTWTSLPDLT